MARKMVKFIEVTSIGVSKEAQFRASKILGAVCDVYESSTELPESEKFFEYFKRVMTERWDKLREVVKGNEIFSLPKFPQEYCLFSKELAETRPGNRSLDATEQNLLSMSRGDCSDDKLALTRLRFVGTFDFESIRVAEVQGGVGGRREPAQSPQDTR